MVFLQITALLVLSILLFRLNTCLFFITKNARELYAQTPYPYATPCPVFLLSSAPRKKKTPLRFCMHMCQNAYMPNAKGQTAKKKCAGYASPFMDRTLSKITSLNSRPTSLIPHHALMVCEMLHDQILNIKHLVGLRQEPLHSHLLRPLYALPRDIRRNRDNLRPFPVLAR